MIVQADIITVDLMSGMFKISKGYVELAVIQYYSPDFGLKLLSDINPQQRLLGVHRITETKWFLPFCALRAIVSNKRHLAQHELFRENVFFFAVDTGN